MSGVALGKLLAEACRNRPKIRMSLRYGRAILQASEHGQRMTVPIFFGGSIQVERSPNLGSGGEIKISRRNANHAEFLAIQKQLLADETGIGAEILLPESVTDDHRGHNTAPEIGRANVAARLCRHAKQ